MQRRWWIMMLAVGITCCAKPTGQRVKRAWHQWTAAQAWNACKDLPSDGSRDGEPCAWLRIPAGKIDLLVLDGAEKTRLSQSPCREQVGRSTLIMAHRDTHFQGLENIAEGDAIQLDLRGGQQQAFHVRKIYIVDKNEIEGLIDAHGKKQDLLLLTCYPFGYIGPAPQRVLVLADPI